LSLDLAYTKPGKLNVSYITLALRHKKCKTNTGLKEELRPEETGHIGDGITDRTAPGVEIMITIKDPQFNQLRLMLS
jgi:hypothetical protein